MKIENNLNLLMEDTEQLDVDLLEAVRLKIAADETLSEGKKEESEDEKTEEEGNAPADAQEETPAVTIDNPINPDLNASDTDGNGVPDEEEEQQQAVQESAQQKSVKESVQELLGDEFSEDFKLKAVTIFEAAVKEQVMKIEESLKAEYAQKTTKLQEDFDIKLTEEVGRIEENLSEEINGYLTIVSEDWMRKNALAVQAGIKADLVESFIDGMKTLFEEHYVDLPETKVDVVSKLEEDKKSLETQLAESVAATEELAGKLNTMLRGQIISESAKDFTDLDFQRFKVLIEDFDFEGEETFRKKVDIVKKAFFETKQERSTQKVDQLNESFATAAVIVEEKTIVEEPTGSMSQYLKYLNKK